MTILLSKWNRLGQSRTRLKSEGGNLVWENKSTSVCLLPFSNKAQWGFLYLWRIDVSIVKLSKLGGNMTNTATRALWFRLCALREVFLPKDRASSILLTLLVGGSTVQAISSYKSDGMDLFGCAFKYRVKFLTEIEFQLPVDKVFGFIAYGTKRVSKGKV